jgi:hypothetical protein
MTDETTPLRDIVIETRTDVKHIRESIDKLTQCMHEQDIRLREVEICGSKISKETAGTVLLLEDRVSKIKSKVDRNTVILSVIGAVASISLAATISAGWTWILSKL